MKALRLIGLAAMLAGCATAYQPMGFSGGYTELQLSQDTYRVTVSGNGYTSTNRAEEIALLRAAELTLEKGFERFAVVGGGVSQEYAGTTPVYANRIGNSVFVTGGDEVRKPNGTITVRFIPKTDPAFASAMDARLISAQLKPKLTS